MQTAITLINKISTPFRILNSPTVLLPEDILKEALYCHKKGIQYLLLHDAFNERAIKPCSYDKKTLKEKILNDTITYIY